MKLMYLIFPQPLPSTNNMESLRQDYSQGPKALTSVDRITPNRQSIGNSILGKGYTP